MPEHEQTKEQQLESNARELARQAVRAVLERNRVTYSSRTVIYRNQALAFYDRLVEEILNALGFDPDRVVPTQLNVEQVAVELIWARPDVAARLADAARLSCHDANIVLSNSPQEVLDSLAQAGIIDRSKPPVRITRRGWEVIEELIKLRKIPRTWIEHRRALNNIRKNTLRAPWM